MPVRNEAWILGLSARVALQWCDSLVLLDHVGSEATSEPFCDFAQDNDYRDRLHLMRVGGDWNEMKHRHAMLERARREGATHVALVDTDEVLTGNLLEPTPQMHGSAPRESPIRNMVGVLRPGHILQLPLYNLRNGIEQYHSNGIWGRRITSVAFADDAELNWVGDCFHHREPMGKTLVPYSPVRQGQAGVMHLWGASERRLKAKHALYKITERLRFPEKPMRTIDEMYSWAIHGRPGDTPATWTFQHVCDSWWQPYNCLMQYLDVDAEPWQEAECRRLIAEHGAQRFAGLDLLGVV